MSSPPEAPDRLGGYRLLAFAPFILTGLFLILVSTDVISYPAPRTRRPAVFSNPHHWQITVFGCMFMLAGLAAGLPARFAKTRRVFGGLCAIAFLAGLIGVAVYMARK